MEKYRLNVKNGKVEYLVMSGNAPVQKETTKENAEWIIREKGGATNEQIKGLPEFPVFAGGYYFAGTWDEEKSIFDDGEKKPRKRRKNVLTEE